MRPTSHEKTARKARWWLAAAAGCAGLFVFWVASESSQSVEPVTREQRPPAPRVPSLDAAVAPPDARPAPPRTPRAAPEPGCASRERRSCLEGDVWWFDGCDEPEELAEECDLTLCLDGACQHPDPLGCDEPITGRCDGDRVRSCFGGRLRVIDCAGQGLSCVMGAEGAECRPRASAEQPASCTGTEARCDEQVLVQCLGALEARTDCAALGATCLQDVPGAAAACIALGAGGSGASSPECGPCGCEPDDPLARETCDGEDEDGDGLIDEGADCGPLDVVALVVGRPGVFGSYVPADIEQEIARVNESLALSQGSSAASALSVRLVETRWIERQDYLQLSERELNELVDAPLTHPARDDFYVPILFTDEVQVGGVPKPGASTLPNGSCGGHQTGRGPSVGLIAVSKPRAPTTVAHELGHFLGLCHTHEVAAGPRPLLSEADGSLLACDEACRHEGDGVCDTPLDPGAERCPYNSQCQVFCPGPESPDPSNLMSYYTACRVRFSREQLDRMQHTRALRVGWQACLDGDCACTLGVGDCPTGMGCRRLQSEPGAPVIARCVLEGPQAAGRACDSGFDCQGDAACVDVHGQARCVRLCATSTPGCHCQAADGALRFCAEDLRR